MKSDMYRNNIFFSKFNQCLQIGLFGSFLFSKQKPEENKIEASSVTSHFFCWLKLYYNTSENILGNDLKCNIADFVVRYQFSFLSRFLLFVFLCIRNKGNHGNDCNI